MTKQVQRRRGTSTQHTSFTGAEGEITVDTTNKSVRVHDGTTAGGIQAARADLANVSDASLNSALSGNTLASLTITSADINGGTIDGTTIGGTSPAAVTTTSLVATTADINGGTVDGAVIGGSSAAAITGTTITATGDVTIADKIVHAGDTNTAIRFPAADTVTVETSGAERLRIDSQGRVGLSATSLNLRLQVAALSSSSSTAIGATDTDYVATFRSSQLVYSPVDTTGTTFGISNSNLGLLQFLNNTNTVIGVNSNTPLIFATTSLERMRITGAGNVGIGKTNPTVALDVVGGITSTGSIVTSGTSFNMTGQSTSDQTIKVGLARTGSGNSYIDLIGDTTYTGFGTRLIRGNTGENANSLLQHRGTGALSLYANDAGIVSFFTNAAERMRITSTGNVGIGTSSPTSRLTISDNSITPLIVDSGSGADNTRGIAFDVGGNNYGRILTASGSGGAMAFWTGTINAASERMRITTAGNVGIGTSSPLVPLQVVGDIMFGSATVSAAQYTLSLLNGTSDTTIFRRYSSGNLAEIRQTGGSFQTVTQGANPLIFGTTATERVRIDASGNVLIGGTATPASATASLAIFNGTAPTGSVTNGVVLYAEDVSSSSELKVRDEAGNVTTLSPHNFDLIPEGPSEDMAWSYYSERDGKRINVDMLKAIRLLESITGEKLVHIV